MKYVVISYFTDPLVFSTLSLKKKGIVLKLFANQSRQIYLCKNAGYVKLVI